MAEQTFSFEDLKLVAAWPLRIKSVVIEATPSITGKYVFIKQNAHGRRKIDLLLIENEPSSLPRFISIDWFEGVKNNSIFQIGFIIVDRELRVLNVEVVQE